MKKILALLSISILPSAHATTDAVKAKSIYDFTPKTALSGKEEPLSKYKGKVLLIVNTASKCGFTPQYEALQKLYETYSAQGFVILGFPSNDFGSQEPGSNAEICEFTKNKFHVSFPLYEKNKVTTSEMQPVYQWLIAQDPTHAAVAWNFEKVLISRDGKWIARYKSKVVPNDPSLTQAIETALKSK
jgi:glutathione peroxidase